MENFGDLEFTNNVWICLTHGGRFVICDVLVEMEAGLIVAGIVVVVDFASVVIGVVDIVGFVVELLVDGANVVVVITCVEIGEVVVDIRAVELFVSGSDVVAVLLVDDDIVVGFVVFSWLVVLALENVAVVEDPVVLRSVGFVVVSPVVAVACVVSTPWDVGENVVDDVFFVGSK